MRTWKGELFMIKDFTKDEYDEFISLFSVTNAWHLIRKMLSVVDDSYLEEGERVGFILLRLCQEQQLDQKKTRNLVFSALFHDIGRIWQSSSDKANLFDYSSHYDHALSSYLFLKYFSPQKEYAEIVLFQNGREDKQQNNPFYPLGVKLHLAIAVEEMHSQGKSNEEILAAIRKGKNRLFNAKDVGDMEKLISKSNLLIQLDSTSYHETIDEFLSSLYFRRDVVRNYLFMVTYCIEAYNSETMYHARITSFLCYLLGRYKNLPLHDLCVLFTAGLFGDIGKIRIPHAILEKPGKLTEEEQQVMMKHIDYTKEILEGCFKDKEVVEVAYAHHERLDGSGYPLHKKADELSLEQRIAAVADCAAAMMAARAYKNAFSIDQTVGELEAMKDQGKLDPEIVEIFKENKTEIAAYIQRHLNRMMRDIASMSAERERLKYANAWY
jgi:HD-GYP domain-containing protein (c-di-GMP phosphodiesterase class II)